MKKILILTLTFLTLISCSEENEQEPKAEKDPLIGNWYVFINGSPCTKNFTTSFNENGTYIAEDFEITPTGDCEALETDTFKWSKKSDNNYIITRNGRDVDFIVNFNNNDTFTVDLGEIVTYIRK